MNRRFFVRQGLAVFVLGLSGIFGCSSKAPAPTPAATSTPTASSTATSSAPEAAKTSSKPSRTLKVGLSIYTGWMPHYLAEKIGIYKEEAAKAGLEVEIVYFPTYGKSLDAYNAKQIDAVVIANMDVLSGPCQNGIDSTVVVMGDYSNGNDKVLVRGGLTAEALVAEPIMLFEGTVSQYLTARMLQKAGLNASGIKIINTPDDKHVTAFQSDESVRAIATWNPWAMQLAELRGVTSIFDSSMIPGEIQDWLIARTDVLEEYPAFGPMLTRTWYRTLNYIQAPETKDKAIAYMAKESMCTNDAEFLAQLKTTAMFWTPELANKFTQSNENVEAMTRVLEYCREAGLVKPESKIGIAFPDGTVVGDKDAVSLHFDVEYANAANGDKL